MPIAYDALIPSLKKLLPDPVLDRIGRAVAFIRRLRELQACTFVWAVVLSRFGGKRPGFEAARQWHARLGGREIWPRPFQMRFKSEHCVSLFEAAFAQAVAPWRGKARSGVRHPLARHFPDVVPIDSTSLQVADELRPFYKGTRAAKAALKVVLGISVFGLLPLVAAVLPGNRHDMVVFPPLEAFRVGSLLLFDKGFVAYARLRAISAAQLHYLCPMRLNGNVIITRVRRAPAYVRRAVKRSRNAVWLRDLLPAKRSIRKTWDVDVVLWPSTLALSKAVPTRLVIIPGPKGAQRPYLTSLDAQSWSPAALAELYRLRWQIELVFKELKQHLSLESLPSKDPHAVKVFAWASLIALALSRCVTDWLMPRSKAVGLEAVVRPALATRALAGLTRILARALVAPVRIAVQLLAILADELLVEMRRIDRQREDTFQRLRPLISARAPA